MTANNISCLVNGIPQHTVTVLDRGLQYGDGLFETIAICDGQIGYWQAHWSRLLKGCDALDLKAPDEATVRADCEKLIAGLNSGVLKIMLTRGEAGQGYKPQALTKSNCITMIRPWPDHPVTHRTGGIALHVCQTRLSINPRLAGIKHLNRLEQVLGSSEYDDKKFAEGLMLDTDGQVIEGTRSNLFAVRQNKLITPPLDQCGVEGVMRSVVLHLAARLGIHSKIEAITLEQLATADELFMTNSLIGIWPVRQLQEQLFAVGPVTLRLIENLDICPTEDLGQVT